MSGVVFAKGHDFKGPDGQGYVLTTDVHVYDLITAQHFTPYGGAPEPVTGEERPNWLTRQIWSGWPVGDLS